MSLQRTVLRPHRVGDIFGVGAFVTQRSWNIADLMVSRANLLGAHWVREELTATRLHSGPNAPYHWATFDRVVNLERRSGIQILGLLDYSNTWRFGDHGTMPHAAVRLLSADFARYAYAVARHFRGRIRYWQVWNEPDRLVYWHPAPSPGDYATLLSAAYRAIKRADRRNVVVMAGTSGVDLPFVRAVAARTRAFDVVSVHPYRNEPESDLLQQVASLRRLHRPIWFTEIGWAAGYGCEVCTSEDQQASYLLRFYALSAAAGVQRIFWYDLRDDAHVASDPEGHFGLLRYDLSGKPAFAAYGFLARLLAGARFTGAESAGQDGDYALRFSTSRGPAVVAWTTGYGASGVGVGWSAGSAVELDSMGNVISSVDVRDGWAVINLPADGSPVYMLSSPSLAPRIPPGPLLHFAPPATPVPRVTRSAARRVRIIRRPPVGRRKVVVNHAAWAIRPSPVKHSSKRPVPRRRELVLPTSTPSPTPTITEVMATPQPIGQP